MSAHYPFQPYKGTEKFVVSIDIGTTQSAVSFAHLVPESSPQPRMVNHWPGQAPSEDIAKIPTIVSYRNGAIQACGETAMPDLEENSTNVARWFKLHIHPSTMPRPEHFEIPDLPPGVTVHHAYRDIMKYLMENTQKFFEKTTPNGEATWKRLRDKMIIILPTPNGWDLREQAILRTAAVEAEIVAPKDADLLIYFVTEAEAAVHYALARYPERWLDKDTVFSVVDAGGSTVDITVYKCASTSPLRLREVCPSQCIQAGGIFVNREVEKLLYSRLQGSKYQDPVIIRDMLSFFEKELKPKFDGTQDTYPIRFGTIRDNEASTGIYKGSITLSRGDLKVAFDNAVDQIIACYTGVIKAHKPKYILLVGGFGESPYLQETLAKTFNARGTQVILVGDYSRKAAAEGATIAYTKQPIEARAARATFGGCVRQLYDRKLHDSRKMYSSVDTDGKTRIDNTFQPWVTKGTVLKEDFAHRLSYNNTWDAASIKKEDLAAQLGRIAVEVYAWESNEPVPTWCKDEKGCVFPGMRSVCTLDADLSALAPSLKVTSGRGAKFYRVKYDVYIYFGGTSLRASLEWREGKIIRQGPVAVIPTPEHSSAGDGK